MVIVFAAILATFGLAGNGKADVLFVPRDFPTIQAGLDTASSGDTIAVSPGIYAEALIAPSIPFTLTGCLYPDSGATVLPVINPSLTPDSVHRGALLLPAGSVPQLEYLQFRNSRNMHLRTDVGGIMNFADSVLIRHCVFDSVYIGFWQPNEMISDVTVDSCDFIDDTARCIHASRGRIITRGCSYSGPCYAQALVGDGSKIEHCTFSDGTQYFILANGDTKILECVFSSSLRHPWETVYCGHASGAISNCLFMGIQSVASALYVQPANGDTVVVANNLFVSCKTSCLAFGCDSEQDTCFARIEGNTFLNGDSTISAKAMSVPSSCCISNNTIRNMLPLNASTVIVGPSYDGTRAQMRRNRFDSTGYALRNFAADTIDARFNYWGDSTGPYHATENPNGQGDEIRGNVLFTPWYPDTNFLDIPELNTPLPQEFSLKIFPNPFNAQTTLQFEVPNAGIYSVALFDITGRQVRELFRGPMIYRETIRFNADNISSGIYFVRAWDVIGRRPLATAKLALIR